MSYKALYDKKYFLTLSALVMLFKAYPTYIYVSYPTDDVS